MTNLKEIIFFSETFVLITAYPSVACFAKQNVLSESSFTLILFPLFIIPFSTNMPATVVKITRPLRPYD